MVASSFWERTFRLRYSREFEGFRQLIFEGQALNYSGSLLQSFYGLYVLHESRLESMQGF